MPSPYPTAGLCPKTLHLDLVIPRGDSIQVLPAVSFGSANATAELPGKGLCLDYDCIDFEQYLAPQNDPIKNIYLV